MPQHTKITLKPGQLFSTGYIAQNPTKRTILAQAIPSISPSIAAEHFKKVECFCFSQQKLGPGETMNLPLRFYLSPDIPKKVKQLTLSYTLFDITKPAPDCCG